MPEKQFKITWATALVLSLYVSQWVASDGELTARELIARALEQTRGQSSYSELEMTIHRPDWTRTSKFRVWTQGDSEALIQFTSPARDAGNATLKKGDRMWTYTPKLRRAIRLPRSMMSQDWAGSDFSYNDLARSDTILNHYSHTITHKEHNDDQVIYTIEATPIENSPVVWGKEVLTLQSNHIILSREFYDQDMNLVKKLETLEIGELDGRAVPLRMRISRTGEAERWTEIKYLKADFDIQIDDAKFSLFSLRGED